MSDHLKNTSRTLLFRQDSQFEPMKNFPIVQLNADRATISLYGVHRRNEKVLLQGDYTEYIKTGREGIKQTDGRFVFPFLVLSWIPEAERHHEEFCFVYNLYTKDGEFLCHKRCDSTLQMERTPDIAPVPSVQPLLKRPPQESEESVLEKKVRNLHIQPAASL